MPIWSAATEITSERVKTFDAHWRELAAAQGGIPRRRAIDPGDFRALLPNVVIADFDPDTLAVRYRLVGTRVAELSRMDYTGRTLEELAFQVAQPEIWQDSYRRIAETQAPVYGRVDIPSAVTGEPMVREEFGIFPLTVDDGRIRQCIAVEDYEPSVPFMDLAQLRGMRVRGGDGQD
jgi:hypothetical protein